MIRTYLADITPLLEPDAYEYCCTLVPKWRRNKAERIKHKKNKAQSIGAWLLLEAARRETGADASHVYNLSHSGCYVLCVLSDTAGAVRAGCDIEMVGDAKMGVAHRFFLKSEYEKLLESEDKAELFYRFWVLKESFMKATRLGMKLGMDQFEIGFDKDDRPVLISQPNAYKEKFRYKEYNIEGIDAKMAVCTTEEEIADVVEIVDLMRMLPERGNVDETAEDEVDG